MPAGVHGNAGHLLHQRHKHPGRCQRPGGWADLPYRLRGKIFLCCLKVQHTTSPALFPPCYVLDGGVPCQSLIVCLIPICNDDLSYPLSTLPFSIRSMSTSLRSFQLLSPFFASLMATSPALFFGCPVPRSTNVMQVTFHNLWTLASHAADSTAVRDGHLFSLYLMLPLATTTLGLLLFNWYPSQARRTPGGTAPATACTTCMCAAWHGLGINALVQVRCKRCPG